MLAVSAPLQAQQLAATAASPKLKPADKTPPAKAETTRTRFIVNLERHVDFEVSALSQPHRVLVDLPDVRVVLPDAPGDTPVGLIKSFRHGMSAPGKSRVIIDVTGPVVVERTEIEKGPDGKSAKLTIDIVSASEGTAAMEARAAMRAGALGLGAVGVQPPVPKPAVSPQARAAGAYKPVIVLDPGHGGDDSGATRFGTVEKNVVLSFSLKLREKLNATGRYKVLMTRDTDTFIPLEERREFAERHQAALFMAIHADYTARASARGATIYSLRPQMADSLRRSAQGGLDESVLSGKEAALVQKANGDVGTVRSILADLARHELDLNRERTSVFVRSVINFMGGSTNLMDNPDRGAAFVVLKTAKMPSILIELGYITNAEDAQQLKSDQWRDKVSGSIVTAIDSYFAKLPR
ncbi:MAG: N-acetylmuramoyl-L-alanine amidase [Hyphomonadaceae bacterium]|nr:N-acetylmuramoyl-L-alanine amidase [Hyphomonadaceae bacterium]